MTGEPRLLTRRDVVALLEGAGRSARRSLGQNFVVDPNTIRRIVRLAGVVPGDRVVEIGPGLGSLTLGLLGAGADVTAVERDPVVADLLGGVLADLAPGARVSVVVGDAAALQWAASLEGPAKLVSNLPYNIATPLLIDVLDRVPSLDGGLVMVQQEVARRLAARAGEGDYGIPSVRVAYRAEAKVVASVPPTVFHPVPRVTSALLAFRRHRRPPVDPVDEQLMFDLVRTAFGQRRKTLRRSLSGLVTEEVFVGARVDPADRPERVDLEGWARLADGVSRSKGSGLG